MGQVVTVQGRLRSVDLRPADSLATLVAELYDGTDAIQLVWLGRRSIPGIEPGRTILAKGRIANRDGVKTHLQPRLRTAPRARMNSPAQGPAASVPPADPDVTPGAPGPADAAKPRTTPTIFDQMGGPAGMIDSGLPVVVFVIANSIGGLTTGIIAALVAAAGIFAFRLSQKQAGDAGGQRPVRGRYRRLHRLQVRLRGRLLPARHLELPGLRVGAAAVDGRPVAGDRADLGGHQRARHRLAQGPGAGPQVRLGHRSSGLSCSPSATSYRAPCWSGDQIGWLGFARIAMGYPLWILAIGACVLIVMRGTGWKRPPLKTLLGKR